VEDGGDGDVIDDDVFLSGNFSPSRRELYYYLDAYFSELLEFAPYGAWATWQI